ncbi:MAG TPA: LLM class flavin-dependent oxidoreductase [Flavobacteriales bacterium]|nr:LLM class flavin-dependent oxidoreductase [Flavobacteriales bacterium]HMR25972.1 LLM class flavin-dependent oxidoreductase [Flavobacteriales bacterium]
MEFGLYTFVDHTPDPVTGERISAQERHSQLLEEAELADRLGLDVFAIGEHHREDFIASAPAVLLAAIAARTTRIRLGSAVTVLSSEDPVRVYQQYATLDLLSGGRAEVMAGRGSFTESFPLFGYDLADYDTLFSEKLAMLLEVRKSERLSWKGRHTPTIADRGVYPRAVQDPLPVWVAVGGTPESAVRAAVLGLPMTLAIIGGDPARFKPFTDLYRKAWQQAGHPMDRFQLGIGSHGFIADSFEEAAELTWPRYAMQMGRIGRERGWGPVGRPQFDFEVSPQGAMLLGDPETVARKIVREHALFGFTRFSLQFSVGSMPHHKLLRAIELYATEVVPRVKAAVGA